MQPFVGPVWICQERNRKCLEAPPSYGRALFSGSQSPELDMNFEVGSVWGCASRENISDMRNK